MLPPKGEALTYAHPCCYKSDEEFPMDRLDAQKFPHKIWHRRNNWLRTFISMPNNLYAGKWINADLSLENCMRESSVPNSQHRPCKRNRHSRITEVFFELFNPGRCHHSNLQAPDPFSEGNTLAPFGKRTGDFFS